MKGFSTFSCLALSSQYGPVLWSPHLGRESKERKLSQPEEKKRKEEEEEEEENNNILFHPTFFPFFPGHGCMCTTRSYRGQDVRHNKTAFAYSRSIMSSRIFLFPLPHPLQKKNSDGLCPQYIHTSIRTFPARPVHLHLSKSLSQFAYYLQ